MHDGMHYDPIQCQGQGHESLKVGNPSIFKSWTPVDPPLVSALMARVNVARRVRSRVVANVYCCAGL